MRARSPLAAAVLVTLALGLASAARPAASPDAATLHFRGDFESGDFSQWPGLYDLGPKYRPEQSLSRVVDHPAGGKMARIVVSESLAPGNSRSGRMSMLNHDINQPWEREGAETWYRVRLLLPSGRHSHYPGRFHAVQPVKGGWNTFLSWHEYRVGSQSPAFGVSTWCRCLQMKWVGGRGTVYYIDDKNPRTGGRVPLRFDHWYDILFHVKWSGSPRVGYAEIWADGRKWFGPRMHGLPARWATLWRHANGRPAYTYATVGHYRRNLRQLGMRNYGDDTVYVDDFLVGPTRASVGG
jgi:Polysaccharide lyase